MVGVPALESGTNHGPRPDLADQPMEHRACVIERADKPAVRQAQKMTPLDTGHVHCLLHLLLAHRLQSVVAARRHPRRLDAHAGAYQQRQRAADEDVVVRMWKHEEDDSRLSWEISWLPALHAKKIDHASHPKCQPPRYAVR